MNAVEIEAAISELADTPFDPAEFPFAFLAAFGNKETTITRLRRGDTNRSDVPGGVLQQNNIHIAVCSAGAVSETLKRLRDSPKTSTAKAKFILATDGEWLEAEELASGDCIAWAYSELPQHFGFFLPLAGITTVKEIKENPIDIRATSRLNKLYVELLKQNPEWGTEAKKHAMNHFMARLIFCFFAEDTDVFARPSLFTQTIRQVSDPDGSNVQVVLEQTFRAMNTRPEDRASANLPTWATVFPYVNGGLFENNPETPKFSRIARSYLLRAGELNWREINPDIFGSMIQAIADDDERGALGMHYTSVPNILKVLNPLFLDDLREQLEKAGNNTHALLRLLNRMSRIRVFDPACGSGNFLVIAYKQMRAVEAEINRRLENRKLGSEIPISNFRGIEIRGFAAEIARLALIIAEFQCNVNYIGNVNARAIFLPLDNENWIRCGNALRMKWEEVCPPRGAKVKLSANDLFDTPLDQPTIDFDNAGGEIFICSNPPYKGSKWQSTEQKDDLSYAWSRHPSLAKSTDFVTGWIAKYLDYVTHANYAKAAFVSTNSICQGNHVSSMWPVILKQNIEITFAYRSFKWQNLASKNAGVTVVIVGLGKSSPIPKLLHDESVIRQCTRIGPYLVPDSLDIVQPKLEPCDGQSKMLFGNMPRDGGFLFLDQDDVQRISANSRSSKLIKRFLGSEELIHGKLRHCLWIEDDNLQDAMSDTEIARRLNQVAEIRNESKAPSTRLYASRPYRFVQIAGSAKSHTIAIPRVSSENRNYLPVDLVGCEYVIGDRNFALYDAPLWNLALIASRLHWVWIATVCVRLRTDFSYSNTLGWNTFPVPPLTEQNKAELTRCGEEVLLAREAHYPATIADLYDPDKMPEDLRRAHERNDETLERIYIGRRFKNDTERLEKLFDMYTKMVAAKPHVKKTRSVKN